MEPSWASSPAPKDPQPSWVQSEPSPFGPPSTSTPQAIPSFSSSDITSSSVGDVSRSTDRGSIVSRRAAFSPEDHTLNFFQPLCVPDPMLRKAALDEMCRFLEQSAADGASELAHACVKAHYRTIVRLAKESPFPEMRVAFSHLVPKLQENKKLELPNVPVSQSAPSYFFTQTGLEAPDDAEVLRILQDIFVRTGSRVTHIDRVLAWHPSFHEKWFVTLHFLLRESGPLAIPVRHYIAIVSASRHKCQYLVRLQEQEFLLNNGDPKWLEGIEHVPKKVHALLPLIAILAHQPWLLTKEHISVLTKGNDAWSIAELVHAIVLTVTFTSLSSLIWATGISPEIDLPGSENPMLVDPAAIDGAAVGGAASGPQQEEDLINEQKKILAELLKKRAAPKADETSTLPHESKVELFAKASDGESLQMLPSHSDAAASLKRYVGEHTLQHADFDVKSKDYRPFRDQDYSWQEQGYSLVSRYYADLAPLLDEEFRHIYSMTYNTFTEATDIDTSPFRFSIWHYVHRIKGLLHDDYNYRDVNTYLSKAIKTFIKKVVCAPETIVKGDLQTIGPFTAEEKVHIVLLAVESRKQAELTYGLHALMKQMLKT